MLLLAETDPPTLENQDTGEAIGEDHPMMREAATIASASGNATATGARSIAT
jgi:hypothetical protein